MSKKTSSNGTNSKEKQTGYEEFGKGLGYVIKGSSDALFNVLAATYEGGKWVSDKISIATGSKDPEIRESREKIAKHHLNQSKESLIRAGKGAWLATKGTLHATKGAVRTVLQSGKDTVQSLREEDNSDDKNDKKQP